MKKRPLLLSLFAMFFAILANAAETETTVINLSTIVEGEYAGYKMNYEMITITSNGDYELTGTTERAGEEIQSTQKIIYISSGLTVNLTLNEVSIINESRDCLSLDPGATVNLTIKGTNRLYSRDCTGIGIGSNKINIKGSGTDALLICEGWSQGISCGAGRLTIDSGTIISYGKSTGMTFAYSTLTINGGIFIGASIDNHISGINDQIIRVDLQEAATTDTKLALYQGNDKITTFNLPVGYKKVDFTAAKGISYSLKIGETEMGSGFTAGNLYTVSLKGTGVENPYIPIDHVYVCGKNLVIETLKARCIVIYNMNGQIVHSVDLQEGINQINNLNTGTYIIDGRKVIIM